MKKPRAEKVRLKNQRYYSKNRNDILRAVFFKNIRLMRTKKPNRHTIKAFGLTPEKVLELQKEALSENNCDTVKTYYEDLHRFVQKKLK
jgi:hypothetical protein